MQLLLQDPTRSDVLGEMVSNQKQQALKRKNSRNCTATSRRVHEQGGRIRQRKKLRATAGGTTREKIRDTI